MYLPPRPTSLPALVALARAMLRGDGDLLSLLPAAAYRMEMGWIGHSRRTILLVNQPEWVRAILADPENIYPKNDLMVGALAPLVGDSIFVSSGATWRRQRRMIDPAFSQLRLTSAFPAMSAAVDDYETHLDALAVRGATFSLDLAMSHLTADIICRSVFSTSLKSQAARDVFDAFTIFERNVAHVEIRRLIFDKPFAKIPHQAGVLAACALIRHHLGALVDSHIADGARFEDIAAQVMDARDPETGDGFSREEVLDQLGVLFLAGHETTASALIWAFYMMALQPGMLARARAEVEDVAGAGPIEFEHVKRLGLVRSIFRETLRLYPPITFIPRVALRDHDIGGKRVKRGAMIMIAPWVLHRHHALWRDPDAFDPDRFSPAREAELRMGAYIPFGLGPRVCAGAAFATTEAALILARLLRRYDFDIQTPERVRPAARLTTRPREQIFARVRRRG